MTNFTIDSTEVNASLSIAKYLFDNLKDIYSSKRPIIFLCIGSDKSTGDCLGPLIGYKLNNINVANIYIYGSLLNPVHSKNLEYTLKEIYSTYSDPYIIAIDACLGHLKNIGKIFINEKPLRPGLALKKSLPQVGDMSITGIVNISGNFEFLTLQNTRLFTVMQLADSISLGICDFILRCTTHLSNAQSSRR